MVELTGRSLPRASFGLAELETKLAVLHDELNGITDALLEWADQPNAENHQAAALDFSERFLAVGAELTNISQQLRGIFVPRHRPNGAARTASRICRQLALECNDTARLAADWTADAAAGALRTTRRIADTAGQMRDTLAELSRREAAY